VNNVTPIRPAEPIRPEIAAAIKQAIENQQSRVLNLVGILECLIVAADTDGAPNFDAALTGAKDLADDIYRALDPGAIVEAAVKCEGGAS